MRRLRRARPVALALLACLAGPATAMAGTPVDLELLLAVDVSPSVDDFEARQQRDGYAAALTHPSVVSAIQGGLIGRIAVAYVEWAGEDYQRSVVGWTAIHDAASARAFVARLAARPIGRAPYTSISGVIDFARRAFDDNGFDGTRRVIDISGDGRNYSGRPISFARADVLANGITINALPMIHLDEEGRELNPGLDRYYSQRVVGGPGAFMVPALGANAFPAAILRKLIIEIAGIEPGLDDDLSGDAPYALALQHVEAAGDDDRGAGEGE